MERTKGSQSEIGMIYQYAVTAYLAGQLSTNESIKDYIIYSSVKSACKFDDIVARIQLKAKDEWFLSLIQVKHKERKKLNISDIIKGKTVEYDVSEYISSFDEITDDSTLACRRDIPSDNIRFCVFSNKNIQTPVFLRSECTFQLNLRRYCKSDFMTKALLPFGDKYWKFECKDLIGSRYQRFLDRCYLYLEQASYSNIFKRIQDSCGIDNANDIVNYVKDYFNTNFLHKQGLHKQIFDIELQKIRLSNYIPPLTQLIDLVDDDRVAIWNEITLHHYITIANKSDDGDIEGCLHSCFAERLKFLLKTDIDWNRLVIEQRELDHHVINQFLEYSKTKTVRHWISPPSTLKLLILELWKFGDLPLILKMDTKLNHFEKYIHLGRSYVVIGDVEKQFDDISNSKLNIFSNLASIANPKLRNRMLENTVISFQGRQKTTLKELLRDDVELLATFTAVDVIGLMKKRIAYLSEDCLRDTNYLAFFVEDDKCPVNGKIPEPHVIGDNIIFECHPSKIEGYISTLKKDSSYKYYRIYHLRRVDGRLILVKGQRDALCNYFIDQYGDPVYNSKGSTPIPIIGEMIALNELHHVPRYIRRATVTNISSNSRDSAIFVLSGDVTSIVEPIKFTKDISDIEKTITKGKSYFIKVSASERHDYWNRFSLLKCALLDINVRDGKMELIRYKNCTNLSSIISYDGRRISEIEFFDETADNAVTAVTGEPGMGKSSLLKSFCNVCNTGKYILFYDLIYFQNYLNRNRCLLAKPIECVFEEIHQKMSKKYNNFLRALLRRNRIILVLDSFDEIIPSCEQEVLKFIQTVADTRVQVIIATRLKDCALLMEEFNAQIVKLDPLNGGNEYPMGWSLSTDLLTNIPSEFAKNPLYLNFLQMISQSGQRLTNITRFELYEKVINMKIERRLRKIMLSTSRCAVMDFVTLFERLALVAMFGKETIEEELRWECNTESFDCIKFGIVTHFKRGYPIFDHFTFVEFLVAQWLVKATKTYIYGKVARYIYQRLIDEGKMYVLDILSEHLDLQKAVLRRNIPRIKKLCEESPDCLQDVDKLDRTALHIATICCLDTNKLQSSFQILNMIIQFMQRHGLDMDKRDAIMQWDWTCYVNFDILDAGLFYNLILTVEVYLNQERWKVVECKHPSTVFPIGDFYVVFINAVWRLSIGTICNLLLLQLYEDERFYDLYQACLKSTLNSSERNVAFITEEDLTSLHIACIYGSEQVVQDLIRLGAQINAVDGFGCTPLHYNVMRYPLHGNDGQKNEDLAITRLLLNHGANFNLANSFGNAPLHVTMRLKSTNTLKLLLEKGCNVNIQDAFGKTSLHIAVEEKEPSSIRVLLENGASPEIEDAYGNTPIYLAICDQDEGISRVFLEGGANVNFQNPSGQTVLHRIVSEKLLGKVRLLLENGADANLQDENDSTPLHEAAHNAQEDIARLLLEKGADVNLQEKNGVTALHMAVYQKHMGIIKLLLDKEADVNLRNELGHTPLHIATKFSDEVVVKLLLEKGANVNLQDASGETVLYKAAYGARVDIIRLLLEDGADINLLNDIGYKSLQNTASVTHSDNFKVLLARRISENIQYLGEETVTCRNLFERRVDIIKLFLENDAGAHLFQSKSDSNVPMYIAAHNANDNIVKLFLLQGANINLQNANGETALYAAACGRRTGIIRLLLEHDADVDTQNIFGYSLLHVAAYTASDDTVKLLLEKGASVNVQDAHGETPLQRAVAGRWVENVKFILENETEANLQNRDAFASLHDDESAVRLLLEVSANIHVRNDNAMATVFKIIDKKRENIIKLLLRSGANTNLRDKFGCTPLHFATQRKEKDIIRLLLENGANVNIQNVYDETALHWAVAESRPDIVGLLLEQGADVNLQNKYGRTPFQMLANCAR
ncbi:hypothetical protein Trydic_g19948 [Trypoxylus dichotomus]